MTHRLSDEEFNQLVAEALDSLPPELGEKIANVEVVVEDQPSAEEASGVGARTDGLLGLYHGIPLTERGNHYYGVLPDRIALYKKNIEQYAKSAAEIKEVIRRTVIHEIAHHFGITDPRLDELGWS
jgi:predicted Zn-dependent protease with MMP-like domain